MSLKKFFFIVLQYLQKRIYDEDFEKDLKITSGYISDMISDNSAWIIVKSSSDGNKVRIGDIANIRLFVYKKFEI